MRYETLDFALTHAGCLAIIERSALVSDVFVFPGKQIMDVRAPYSELAGRTDTEPPSADELAGKHKRTEASHKTRAGEASAPYWRQWQDKYDYVYLMYTDEDQANPAPEILTLLYQGDRFQLYKIDKAKR